MGSMKLLGAVLVFGVACGRVDSDAAGGVNSIVRCDENGTCQTGFRCVQRICVTDEADAAGTGGKASSEDDAGPGGSPGDAGAAAGGAQNVGGRLASGGAATGGTTSPRGGATGVGAAPAAGAGGEEPVCSPEKVVPIPFECLPDAPSQSHHVTVLGTLDDSLRWAIAPYAFAQAINGRGVVLVDAQVCSDSRGAVFENGALRPLEPPTTVEIDGPFCMGADINDDGDIVGTCGMNAVPVIWRAGVPEALATPYAGATPQMINNAGTIAFNGPVPHVITAAGEVTEIVLPQPDDYYEIWDMNNVGQVVGRVARHNQEAHAFVWQAGVLTMLPDQGATQSLAAGINDQGQIVGAIDQRSTLWNGDLIIDITPNSGERLIGSHAIAINNHGTAIGWFVDTGARRFGAAYTYDAGVLTWLPGFDNSYPAAINDAGQIAGSTMGYYEIGYAATVWSPACYGPCCGGG
jgi:probable HAF family extracellular repeat protein